MIHLMSEVILPRRARFHKDVDPNQLLYWEHIKQFKSNDEYFAAVKKLDEELELHNVTDQIRELALIVDEKMLYLAALRKHLFIIGISWIVGTAFSVYLMCRG